LKMKSPATAVETGLGMLVDLAQPSPSQICLVDIVHALAQTPRLLGATHPRYSIAQHVVLMMDLLEAMGMKRMGLLYFVQQSHVPYIGDIPRQAQQLISLQKVLTDIIRKLHNVVRKHLEEHYRLPPGSFTWVTAEHVALENLQGIVRAYEAFHLLQGGGWSMQIDMTRVASFSNLVRNRRNFIFDFDKPPRRMEDQQAQYELLVKVNGAIETLQKSAAA
jgi:hypothetical protein